MKFNWMEECECYGNGHEMFHIAQDNLKKEDISKALEEILGENGWAMDGHLEKDGAYFSTAQEDIEALACKLSKEFPDATVFGQDCWDYEGYIVCFENGKPSTNYSATFDIFESENNPEYYNVELDIYAKNGYVFEAGGGLVHEENIPMMNDFIEEGSGDYIPAEKEL